MKNSKSPKKAVQKSAVVDIPSFDLGVLTPKSPAKKTRSTHAMHHTIQSSSPRQMRADSRTKRLHDVDAGGSSTPIDKHLKRKGNEVCVEDDFVEEAPKVQKAKKAKMSTSPSKHEMKKHHKKSPKLAPKEILLKNDPYFAPHNAQYGVLRFHSLCDPSIPSQISQLLSSNALRVFKKTCFGYLLSIPLYACKIKHFIF